MTDTKFAPLEEWVFAYLMHEVRTPLNVMVGFSQMLHDGAYGDLNEMQLDRLDRIVRSAHLLLRRLDLLLDYNALHREQLDLTREAVPFADLLDDALQTAGFDSRGRLLAVELPEPLPDALVDTNRLWAAAALREAIVHAASEAMPDPTVWSYASALPERGLLELRIRFNGPPMDSWQQGNLFTIHNRTGIGLPLALELLSRLGGGMDYDSVATRHEIFVTLPLAQ